MADVKISELPAASTINTSVDALPLVTDSGTVTSKATPNQIVAAVLAANPIPSIAGIASGTLASGDTVVVNSDGTISAVSGTASVVGSSNAFGSGTIRNVQGIYDPNSAYPVVVVYQETIDHYIQVVSGTISGTTITFGTPATIATGDLDDLTFPTVGIYQGTNIGWVTYSPTSDNLLYVVGVDVSANPPQLGTPVVVDPTYATSQAAAVSVWAGPSPGGRPCIAYQTTGVGIRATTFNMTGTTITSVNAAIELSPTGNTTQIQAHNIDGNNILFFFQEGSTPAVCYCQCPTTILELLGTTLVSGLDLSLNTFSTAALDSDNLLLAFAEAENSVLTAVVLDLNYTTLAVTIGNRELIDTSPSTGYGAISTYTYPNGTVGIFYNSQALDNLKTTVIQVDDGNIITIDGVTTLVAGANSSYMWTFPTSNPLQNAVFYFNGAQAYMLYTSSSTNLTDKNFIGYSYADYSTGATATVLTLGSTITGLTGLTPGLQYYVSETGDLSTIPGIPPVNAGTGLTTTSLLFNG